MSRARWTVPLAMSLALLSSAGCSTYAAARYSIAPETVSALRTYRPQTVAVGPLTAAKPGVSEITCRAVGPIKTPDGEPFEEFVRRALTVTVKSSNGKSLRAAEDYPFKASYAGDAACQNTAQALMPAVQNLVGKIVRDAAFADLLR